jgi:hypothetical protein
MGGSPPQVLVSYSAYLMQPPELEVTLKYYPYQDKKLVAKKCLKQRFTNLVIRRHLLQSVLVNQIKARG